MLLSGYGSGWLHQGAETVNHILEVMLRKKANKKEYHILKVEAGLEQIVQDHHKLSFAKATCN